MENNVNPAATEVSTEDVAVQTTGADDNFTADEGMNSDLETLQAELEAAKAEVESARRHCQQKDNEMRSLKRKNLSDPEAIEALEQELEQERQRLIEEGEAAKREFAIKSNSFDVRQTLSEAGVPGSDSIKLAEMITSDDAAESTARAKAIVSVINKVAKEKVKEATNTLLKDNADAPPNGASSAATENTVSLGAAAAQRYAKQKANYTGGNI